MDYIKIGDKIREYRKQSGLSQEQLAERVGISVPHMSHIETANTKLSLPVFLEIARVLNVTTDDLLRDRIDTRKEQYQQIMRILDECDSKQLNFLIDLLTACKKSMDKYDQL